MMSKYLLENVCACWQCLCMSSVHVTLQRLHFHLSPSLVSLFLLLFCHFPHQIWPYAWAAPIKKQKQQSTSGNYINLLIHYSASELQYQGTHTHTRRTTDRKFPRQQQSKCFISICLLCKCVCVYLWTHAESKVSLEPHLVSMKLSLTSEWFSTSSVFMCQSTKTQTDCADNIGHKICHDWTLTNSAEQLRSAYSGYSLSVFWF